MLFSYNAHGGYIT